MQNRSGSEDVASKKMADGGLPVIARFEVRHRNYLAPDGSINRPLPAFASDASLLASLYRAMVLLLRQVNWPNFLNTTSGDLYPCVAFGLEPYLSFLEASPEWERQARESSFLRRPFRASVPRPRPPR